MTARTLAIRNYMDLLDTLSDEMKLALVEGLARSMNSKREKPDIDRLFGAWKDDKSADEIISSLRQSRITNTRQIASFD